MRIISFFNDVIQEFNKISWPKKNETLYFSIIVLLLITFLGGCFFIIDSLSFKVIRLILNI